ncbi:predicted protein [Aspergillus terreus NIH2624]|uniref:ATP-dependent DNA ligase family profile domain-containing protein n=1 Tax=Aspergillus terreus (strain NIH 2624 / FGSC A1156) TaxID=341663 RepID=Q0CAS6_ASPTN|nr:uncharacterized protein ATEG_09208 [Aspergillus terreus NIH2624]EAU30345.1 predicted protein [Aspergillus terreus NIH2624]
MFPDKRTDRVYWLQDTSLARTIGRCLLLGSSRREELERWRTAGGVDLGQCVENVMRQAENHIIPGQEVTVEEIDAALEAIASRCRFSGPRVRRQRTAVDVEEALSPLYRRLSSRDAKWLTRMILKSLSPVVLPGSLVLKSFHFLLPHLLLFQDSFEAALNMLRSSPIANFPPHPEPGLARDLCAIALQHLDPLVGVKIGRPEYYKARSIKHCCQMVGRRRVSVERKYDGEYCQIHIDLMKRPSSIQIFSKSGKDSTADRADIIQVIRDSLRIGKPECKISRRCVLEGEILVWSDKHGKIADFHKLRKFISRSGTFIGIENDSPPQPYERLMIVFFDILLLDDDVCLKKPHRLRRLLLKDTMTVIPTQADIAEQWVLDFSRPDAQTRLENIFARGVAERWEGFVLKGCEDPYFAIFSGDKTDTGGRWIKLKKDYIPGLGDTVDLTVIGGAYKPRDALALNQARKLSWTHFFIGCLTNKDSVLQSAAVPRFRVIDTIDQHCMSVKHMQIFNQIGQFYACSPDSGHGFIIDDPPKHLPAMDVVYKTPFVVEMLGAGFEKPSGARFYTLRFPRIVKIHSDRSFEDAASFVELQRIAEDARAVSVEAVADEKAEWTKRFGLAAGASLYKPDRSQSAHSATTSSQSTGTTTRTLESSGRRDLYGRGDRARESSSHEARQPRRTSLAGASSRPVPIYVDDSTGSVSSSDSENQGNFLKDNENLSSHQNSRKRKASDSGYDSTEKPAKARGLPENANSTASRIVLEPAPSFSRDMRHATTPPTNTPLIPEPPSKHTARSPLSTIPVYVSHNIPGDAAMIIPNRPADLDAFLTAIGSEDTKSRCKASNPNPLGRLIEIPA